LETFKIGDIVLVTFPFSDLSEIKLRPAIIIAYSGKNDYVLSQITSKNYSDKNSVKLIPGDCIEGSLERISFIRPLKLFTASQNIINRKVCKVKGNILKETYDKIIKTFNVKSLE